MSRLLAHLKTQEDLDAIVASPRACYMLVGAARSGRLASAQYVAKMLHCGGQKDCTGCRRIIAGTDPDVLRISPNEKGTVTIEMAHDLVASLSKHPSRKDAKRVVIIESAERMTLAAQNALLKVIEEPPANTLFMLLLQNVKGVLPTIASRCQTIYIRPVTDEQIKEYGGAKLLGIARGRAGLVMDMINDSEEVDSHNNSIARADEILSANPFERMLLVDKLATDKNQAEIIDWLAYKVSKNARTQNGTSQALQSMQNYFIYSSAGVAGKHALTEMMTRL